MYKRNELFLCIKQRKMYKNKCSVQIYRLICNDFQVTKIINKFKNASHNYILGC